MPRPVTLIVYSKPSGRELRFFRSMQSQSWLRPMILMPLTPLTSTMVKPGLPERMNQAVLSKLAPIALPWMSASVAKEYTTAGAAEAAERPPVSNKIAAIAYVHRENLLRFMSFHSLIQCVIHCSQWRLMDYHRPRAFHCQVFFTLPRASFLVFSPFPA